MILFWDIKNLCSLFIHEHIFFFIQGMIDKASSSAILGFDKTEIFQIEFPHFIVAWLELSLYFIIWLNPLNNQNFSML